LPEVSPGEGEGTTSGGPPPRTQAKAKNKAVLGNPKGKAKAPSGPGVAARTSGIAAARAKALAARVAAKTAGAGGEAAAPESGDPFPEVAIAGGLPEQ